MSLSHKLYETTPLIIAFSSAIISSFTGASRKWQNFVLGLVGGLAIFFLVTFFFPLSLLGDDRINVFIALIFTVSLFIGLFPIRKEVTLSPSFLYYLAGGLGIILSNNLLTFFIFWFFQRSIPLISFVKDMKNDASSGGGTYILTHYLNVICFLALLILAFNKNLLTVPFGLIPFEFHSWPILVLTFIIIYSSHGIFPLHSWIHDITGKLSWYEISCLFLARPGVLLFVKFILPYFNQEPDVFRIVLLSLSIFSSIYWSFRGIYEVNVSKGATYFYVAQSSLILTGLQAGLLTIKGSYLHMMVISLSGTALWSILSYIQHYFSIKRLNQYYGLAQYFPKLATLFCLFGFCMIGVPLGASFVVEDLVINGLLDKQPYLGLGHILATCLNGILFFLIFSKLFLGHTAFKQNVKNMDMSLSSMSSYVMALMILLLMGILPFLFLERITW